MLCRCMEKHSNPKRKGENKYNDEYVGYIEPVDYPDTYLRCGLCDNPAVIWLTNKEKQEYVNGKRIFKLTNILQIKLGNQEIKE